MTRSAALCWKAPTTAFPDSDLPYFEEPLIGFAAADDPLFTRFKEIIGEFHFTPAEIMENTYGPGRGEAKTVICWILPIAGATRKSNRKEDKMPSLEWALTRSHGERFNTLLRMFVVDLLRYVSCPGSCPAPFRHVAPG